MGVVERTPRTFVFALRTTCEQRYPRLTKNFVNPPAGGARRSIGRFAIQGRCPVSGDVSARATRKGRHEMPDILVVGVVALVAGLVGFGIALLVRRSFALGGETTARANADRLLAEARAKQKEIILEAKDEAIKTAKTAETENRDRRAELQRYEARLDKKDEQLDQKIAQVDERDRRLGVKEKDLDTEREKI